MDPLDRTVHTALWLLPLIAIGVAVVVVAVLRRDGGWWWRFTLAGGAFVLAHALWSLGEQNLLPGGEVDLALIRTLAVVRTALLAAGVGLLAVAAFVGRGPAASSPVTGGHR